MVIPTIRQIQLHQHIAHMGLHRSLGEHEAVGDAGVGEAFGHQRQNLGFTRREVASPTLRLGGDQVRHDSWIERRAAPLHSLGRVYELADLEDPVLEQVAKAALRDEVNGAGR